MTTPTPGWSTAFESGLLDDFDFTVENSIFAFDAKYNDGNTLLLIWEGKTDDEDTPETRIIWPLGKGWSSPDGGKTIVHDSGKANKNFQGTSLIAKLIERCITDFEIGAVLAERGTQYDSDVWVGLTFHMKSENIDYGGNIGAKAKLLPQRFVGVDGGEKPAKKKATPKVSKAEAEANSASTGDSAADKVAAAKAKAAAAKAKAGGGTLRDRVIAIFEKSDDFASAQDEALAVDGVTEDSELLDSILDESGLWGEVKG